MVGEVDRDRDDLLLLPSLGLILDRERGAGEKLVKLFKNYNEEKKVLELKIVKNLKTKFCSVIRSTAAGARGEEHGGNHLDKQGKEK